jgi:hypothetical protein
LKPVFLQDIADIKDVKPNDKILIIFRKLFIIILK